MGAESVWCNLKSGIFFLVLPLFSCGEHPANVIPSEANAIKLFGFTPTPQVPFSSFSRATFLSFTVGQQEFTLLLGWDEAQKKHILALVPSGYFDSLYKSLEQQVKEWKEQGELGKCVADSDPVSLKFFKPITTSSNESFSLYVPGGRQDGCDPIYTQAFKDAATMLKGYRTLEDVYLAGQENRIKGPFKTGSLSEPYLRTGDPHTPITFDVIIATDKSNPNTYLTTSSTAVPSDGGQVTVTKQQQELSPEDENRLQEGAVFSVFGALAVTALSAGLGLPLVGLCLGGGFVWQLRSDRQAERYKTVRETKESIGSSVLVLMPAQEDENQPGALLNMRVFVLGDPVQLTGGMVFNNGAQVEAFQNACIVFQEQQRLLAESATAQPGDSSALVNPTNCLNVYGAGQLTMKGFSNFYVLLSQEQAQQTLTISYGSLKKDITINRQSPAQ